MTSIVLVTDCSVNKARDILMQFDSQSLWLYLYFPTLQLDSIERSVLNDQSHAHKQAQQQAIAIYQSASNQLVQVNQVAFDRGLRTGMGLAKASLLHSDLQLHEYNPGVEENGIEQIAQRLYMLTSDIALAPPQGLIIRVQRMLHLYQNLENYWRILQYCLADFDVQYHAACAYSIQAAKLLALHGKRVITTERKTIHQQLAACRLAISDMDHKDIDKLERIGIRTFEQLSKVPIAEVANRVSRHSMKIVNELRGQAPAQVKFYQPASEFHDYLELLYEIENTEKLLVVIKRSLHKLEQFLYVRNARSMHIGIDLYLREKAPMKLEFTSALPIYRQEEWLDIIALKLERVQLTSPTHAIEMHCLKYEVTPIANDDLFTKKSQHIAGLSLISRLVSRLGESKVANVQFHSDFRPEYASRVCSIDKTKAQLDVSLQVDRPGILLPQPQPLVAEVTVIKGPERVVSGWWDDDEITRDYFIGEDEKGQQLWIFKTPDHQWYVHGFFV